MNAEVDLTNTILETQRLILREWREDDLDDLYENAHGAELAEIAGWKPHESKEESMRVLNQFITNKNAFAVVYKGNYRVIGNIILEECEQELDESFASLKGRNLRFVINAKYWGHGLMSEAMKSVINYCFHELEFDFVMSGYFIENDIQKSFLEKLGFKQYKRFLYHTNYGVNKEMELTLLYNHLHKKIEDINQHIY